MVRSLDALLAEQQRVLADDRDTHSRGDGKRTRALVEDMLARLAGELVELSEHKLSSLEMPELVRDVVLAAKLMKHGAARNRQLRLVRKELRDCDWFSLRARLQHLLYHGTPLVTQAGSSDQPSPEAEWTVRLLSEGDRALDALLLEHPSAERNHLRALLRETRRATPERKGKFEQRLTAALASIVRPR